MLLELIMIFEVIAFLFLALGILPFKQAGEGGNLPLANKLLFVIVSAIIFFSLAVVASSYEYTYCWVDATSTNIRTYVTEATATCAAHMIESIELAYLNLGMGIISILVGIIIMVVTVSSRFDDLKGEE